MAFTVERHSGRRKGGKVGLALTTVVSRRNRTALLYAERGFRHIKGCDHLSKLIHSLERKNNELASLAKAA